MHRQHRVHVHAEIRISSQTSHHKAEWWIKDSAVAEKLEHGLARLRHHCVCLAAQALHLLIFESVSVSVRACVRACARMRACVCACVCVLELKYMSCTYAYTCTHTNHHAKTHIMQWQ